VPSALTVCNFKTCKNSYGTVFVGNCLKTRLSDYHRLRRNVQRRGYPPAAQYELLLQAAIKKDPSVENDW
jgi:hypothetical protein